MLRNPATIGSVLVYQVDCIDFDLIGIASKLNHSTLFVLVCCPISYCGWQTSHNPFQTNRKDTTVTSEFGDWTYTAVFPTHGSFNHPVNTLSN